MIESSVRFMFDLLKLVCLIFLIVISIVMYIKGIKKIKENDYSSLLFSLLPSIIIKMLFIQLKNEKDPNYLYEKQEKELDIELNIFDEKIEKNNKMQILFYTFCYILLWGIIICLILKILSSYYQYFLNISIFVSKFCLIVLVTMIILIFYIVWKDK